MATVIGSHEGAPRGETDEAPVPSLATVAVINVVHLKPRVLIIARGRITDWSSSSIFSSVRLVRACEFRTEDHTNFKFGGRQYFPSYVQLTAAFSSRKVEDQGHMSPLTLESAAPSFI